MCLSITSSLILWMLSRQGYRRQNYTYPVNAIRTNRMMANVLLLQSALTSSLCCIIFPPQLLQQHRQQQKHSPTRGKMNTKRKPMMIQAPYPPNCCRYWNIYQKMSYCNRYYVIHYCNRYKRMSYWNRYLRRHTVSVIIRFHYVTYDLNAILTQIS